MKALTKKIGIIGGGISGLTAAFLLKNKGFAVTLFEKSPRAGGNVETVESDGFLVEYAPNSLLKSPRLVDLIKTLKLEPEVLAANAANKKRYVLRGGKLKALPMSILKMATDDYFSVRAKMRLIKEPFVRSKSSGRESVADFFSRRLGREVLEKAADPFIAGIYAGKTENLSIRAAFPRLYEMEKTFGSLTLGALRSKTEKAPKDFPRTFSFAKGIQTLTDRLAENLGESIKTNTIVSQIEKLTDGRWRVLTERRQPDGNERESANNFGAQEISPPKNGVDAVRLTALDEIFDALIIATPAEPAANLVGKLNADLSKKLAEVYYPPVAMVYFGVKKESVGQNLDGFGFLIPSTERRRILGTIWNSAVFAGRARAGYHLLTTFIGGARNAELFEKPDDELFEIAFEELKSILDLRAKPDFRHIKRWRKAIPQYEIGYEKIEAAIEEFENKNRGIYFCSNFYKGISMGDCVKNAYQTADEIEEFLKRN